MVEYIGRLGNCQLIRGESRRFPGLLIQGDSLKNLLTSLEEELPRGYATRVVRELVVSYETMMRDAHLKLPYFDDQTDELETDL